jgi:hypothetical protein
MSHEENYKSMFNVQCSLPHLHTRSRTQDGKARELVPEWIVPAPVYKDNRKEKRFVTTN